ncbi:uncharacterized protein BP01DRAFT_419023 [Aspergillus saccharolyticus JOP 1030-1]|uniref:Uncharacterized protein n=1 Tax=Aspergillus saccharolyticus JOP 1030-1 TaxID=1450539 RepID=A0A318Z3W2_9EURO|nr:hypothetical protein BP01DRAFT_419023 [Aspergillus saccharolyticus JOP 1030-1]PYH41007.1 hypothetical protein BP01DRAFT_419023 [Aspergillus saccharolyticus JOP 1030-1]
MSDSEGSRQEKILREQADARNRQATFEEFIQHCYNLLSKPLEVGNCVFKLQRVYNSVRQYLHPLGSEAPRLFSPCVVLEEYGEKDLEVYERFAVENHVFDIISALCKIPSAREEFGLGMGCGSTTTLILLTKVPPDEANSKERPARPDQFCIHRVDGDTRALLTIVEYKPPYKLSNENLRAGLRLMNFYHETKVRYNVAHLAGSAIVQKYHVMILKV